MIRTYASSISQCTVIEFGAAAGLPSLVALSLGAKMVVATDYPSPSVIENLSRNLANHSLSLPRSPSTSFRVISHVWSDERSLSDIMQANNGESFDVALAAECLWRHELHSDLAASLHRVLRVGGRALITFSHHIPGREAHDLQFFEIAESIDLRVASKSSVLAPHMWSDKSVDIFLYELEKIASTTCSI